MWNDLKEILAWLRGEDEASATEEPSSVDSLMRLVAMTTMASLQQARQRDGSLPHQSDESRPPQDPTQPAPAEDADPDGPGTDSDESPPPSFS